MTSRLFPFSVSRIAMSVLLATTASLTLAYSTEIVAHRGYSAIAPENTVAAFKEAWAAGSDACELDLYLTKDGRIVVLHDKDTKRTTGVASVVADATLEALQKLDAGLWKGEKWKGEKMPSLEESLATMPEGNKRFYLEIKCGPEVVPALTKVLEPWKEKRAAQLAVITFNGEAAADTKKAMPWLKVYILASGKDKQKKQRTDVTPFIEQAKKDGLDGLDLGQDWPWSEAMVKQIRDAGLALLVWTVNDPERAREFARLGVDGITTDDPVLIRKALEAGKK